MARFNPFSKVSCKYGAPMGRRNRGLEPFGTLAAKHQGGCDGYDSGGAYWGLPCNVWAVWNKGLGFETVIYVRASSRNHALKVAITEHWPE